MNPYPCLLPMRLRTPPRRVAPVRSDARGLVVEPSVVAQRMGEIDAAATALDRDVATATVPDGFRQDWAAWLARWRAYYANLNNGSLSAWWSRFQSGAVEQVERYEAELRDWRTKFSAASGKAPSGPPLPEDPQGLFPEVAKAAIGVTTLVVVGVAAWFLLKN